jgi:hypothetical protein
MPDCGRGSRRVCLADCSPLSPEVCVRHCSPDCSRGCVRVCVPTCLPVYLPSSWPELPQRAAPASSNCRMQNAKVKMAEPMAGTGRNAPALHVRCWYWPAAAEIGDSPTERQRRTWRGTASFSGSIRAGLTRGWFSVIIVRGLPGAPKPAEFLGASRGTQGKPEIFNSGFLFESAWLCPSRKRQ